MGAVGGSEEAGRTTRLALDLGYRHIDTAAAYGNEEAVGKVIRESNIPRDQIYVVTKLPEAAHGNVVEGFNASLAALGLDYVDLYLMHWPMAHDPATKRVLQPEESPTFVETWLEMEKLLQTGKVRTIGVSNFSVKTLEILLPHVKVVPAVNQIEMNPCLPNDEVFEYCKKKGIAVTAYTPMGRPDAPFYTSPIFLSISEKYNAAVGQILLSWSVQRGAVPIPKSSNPERAKQNITLVKLASEDMAQIDLFHKQEGMHRTLCHRKRVEGTTALFGWTFEQLGWNLGEGGVALE
ncbi:hypothetical protein FRC19_001694 [Serendipita sp. 401]|nr:hypothetical protein FRC15_011729 [Serendipita sp. 397]KAG8801566.1 hypothetical protein FRC16_000171 [Serendipita sp. 398]KAG8824490.1 hypothetical protein FRC19_001694 [Serendipita sp. 401]KAG9055424.1 hypothetical protein FS842_002234 [Serendipita sp. 407]